MKATNTRFRKSNIVKIDKVLIIEDIDKHFKHLERSIKLFNSAITIDSASNENQAIELLNKEIQTTEKNPYDFIIADVNLKEKGGSELGVINFLKYIKENNIEAKVIIITAHSGMVVKDSSGNKRSVLEAARNLDAYACLSRNQGTNYLDEINKILNV